MTPIESYYNKFNEDKRLLSKHGQVEYYVTMTYIQKYLSLLQNTKSSKDLQIIDIGAGTGRYAVALAEEGYDVTAIELVKYNLGILKKKNSSVKAFQGNAVNLKKFADNQFDMALLFGPMYHLISFEEKQKALSEAIRVVRPGGYILVAYCMNDYSILTYGFKENHILECMKEGRILDNFQTSPKEGELYDYVTLSDIDALNTSLSARRVQIIAPDGPADYMRQTLNAMDEDTFQLFLKYQLQNCERSDLLGASSHTVDILQKI